MKRFFKACAFVVAVVVFVGLSVGAFHVLNPRQGTVAAADAIVSLGPQVNRLPHAIELFEAGHADELVISWYGQTLEGGAHSQVDAEPQAATPEEYCVDSFESWVTCFTPDPNNTLGEALAVRAMAEAEGWSTVTVVTDQYHANRAGYIFEHCLGPEVSVEVVYPERALDPLQWGYRILYETAATLKAFVEVRTQC